ncbi:MAG: alpha-glucan family phosphorylase [Candidatus Auribacterota bacterium]|nr:alpha-glucan family phosphorylase [Candidatus Auribacterota bacterium]
MTVTKRRITSVVSCAALVMAFAVTILSASEKRNLSTFHLPPEYGSVGESFTGDGNTLVFQIKDLHSNSDVQYNIAKIIEYITRNYAPQQIFVEGYWGLYDVSPLRNHPADVSTKRTLIEYFSEKGQITGSEYFAFVNETSPELYGIEDRNVYNANRDALQNVLTGNKPVLNYAAILRLALDAHIENSFNPRLRDFYSSYAGCFWKKNLDIGSFSHIVTGHLSYIDASDDELRHIDRLQRIVALEKKILPQILQNDLRTFFFRVKQDFAGEEDLAGLADMFMKYFVGNVSGSDFFKRCTAFIDKHGISLSDYPQMALQIELHRLQGEIRTGELLTSLHTLSWRIMDELAIDSSERDLCRYSEYIEIIKQLVSFNLTNTEWEWLNKTHTDISLASIHKTLGTAGETIVPPPSLEVENCVEQAAQFYRLSIQRDEILYETAMGRVMDNGITCCISITGGFHTDSILESYKKNGISYVSITPATGKHLSTANYAAVMTGYQPYVERLLGIEKFQKNNLAPELVGVNLIVSALDQFDGLAVTERFAHTVYKHLSVMNELPFEAGGTILDLFKSSTPLSPQVVDEFLSGKLTARDTAKILELVLMSGASPYFDPRYLRKLKDNELLDVSHEALDEFEKTIKAIKNIDRKKRKDFVKQIRNHMDGKKTVEPQPIVRSYDKVDDVVNALDGRSVVYFSPEMKLLGGVRSMFWGGLGVLAGEYVEGLADTDVPTYGVTLLYRKVVRQHLSEQGIQITQEIPVDYRHLPIFDTGVVVNVNALGVPVRARVWEIAAGDARIFALEDLTSDLTHMLYGGANETPQLRAQQDQLLGRGGVEALQQLLDKKIIDHAPAILHMNEANCIFVADEVIQRQMFADDLDPNGYWKNVGLAFTTHTPVPAGLPKVASQNFSTDNMMHLGWLLGLDAVTLMRIYAQYAFGTSWNSLTQEQREQLLDLMNKDVDTMIKEFNGFVQSSNIILNLTEAAATLADITSSVSLRHEKVTNTEIINVSKSPSRHNPNETVQSIGITNGVNLHDWQPIEFQSINPDEIPDETLVAVKRREKEEFIDMVNTRAGSNISADHLTISVMRRTNTYKRTDLILQDIDSLAEQLKSEYGDQEINIVFSGISHPKDEPGKAMFKTIQDAVQRKHPTIHVVFVEQYDISVAKYGVRGSDIWLMMPVEKMEASSTSHQKALGAGTMIISSFDGAMIEEVVDIDVDPANSNGAFITPLILNRTIPALAVQFIEGSELYPGSGFYSRPTVSIGSGAPYTPVALIARENYYIVIDEIISDISPQNLMALHNENPIHLRESDFNIAIALNGDGTISQDGINQLLYKSLDPFTTNELMMLYNENRAPWYNLLYQKVKSIANMYYGAQRGDFTAQQQYVEMLRNSVRRSYEVDIRRMALEYIQFMYSRILNESEKRAQTGTTLLEEIIPEDFLLEKVKTRRAEILKAKKDEFDYNLGQRMAWGYMAQNNVGSRVESISTSAVQTDDTHIANTPLTVSVDIAFGLVVQPDDFDVELYYSVAGSQQEMIPMQQTKLIDPTEKQYRFSATFIPEESGYYQLYVALRPKNPYLLNFLNYARENKGKQISAPSRQQQFDAVNDLMDKAVDLAFMKWSNPSAVTVIEPVVARPSIAGLEQAVKRELVDSSL